MALIHSHWCPHKRRAEEKPRAQGGRSWREATSRGRPGPPGAGGGRKDPPTHTHNKRHVVTTPWLQSSCSRLQENAVLLLRTRGKLGARCRKDKGSDLFWSHLSHLSQLGCFRTAPRNTQPPDLPAHLQELPLPLQALGSSVPSWWECLWAGAGSHHQASTSHI